VEEAWPEELRELIDLLSGTSIAELELRDGDLYIALKRGATLSQPVDPKAEPGAYEDANLVFVRAPLLGIFYRAASPGAEAFVHEGDQVEKGQVIGLIEAMKIFNEIQAEVSGRVRAILVEDGAFVEADQRLIALDIHTSEEEPV
jgi:acetyl-CoA carboxylase biotin carboxyl carrier protein